MEPNDIENIDVTLQTREGSNILGLAKIKLRCGILLAGIRIYADKSDPGEIYLSFPTRKDKEGNFEKTYFPYNHQTRSLLTNSVGIIYRNLERRKSAK